MVSEIRKAAMDYVEIEINPISSYEAHKCVESFIAGHKLAKSVKHNPLKCLIGAHYWKYERSERFNVNKEGKDVAVIIFHTFVCDNCPKEKIITQTINNDNTKKRDFGTHQSRNGKHPGEVSKEI